MEVAHRFAPLGQPGRIACPFCGNPIVLDPAKVVRGETIACGHCEATLSVDRAASAGALDALARAMAASASPPPAEGGRTERERRARRPRRRTP